MVVRAASATPPPRAGRFRSAAERNASLCEDRNFGPAFTRLWTRREGGRHDRGRESGSKAK